VKLAFVMAGDRQLSGYDLKLKLAPSNSPSSLRDETRDHSQEIPNHDKMLGINYESSDEEDAIPATKADVSRGHVLQRPR
jgi:hypothetical protein